MYKIACEVYGGVTGHRESFLKGDDGQVRVFETKEDAKAVLPKSYTNVNGVCFNYWIEEGM